MIITIVFDPRFFLVAVLEPRSESLAWMQEELAINDARILPSRVVARFS
jgi:hypothetical protein